MNMQTSVREQLQFWHDTLDQMLSECDAAALNRRVEGATIGSIGSIYAHIVFVEDVLVHGRLRGRTPIYVEGAWEAKTGVAFCGDPPMATPEWSAAVRMDAAPFGAYARTVYAATDAYLAGLADADTVRTVSSPLLGGRTVSWYLSTLIATHLPAHAGEIAALKGLQGLKGLPF